MTKTSQLSITWFSVYLVLLLVTCGWIFGKFPADWYRQTDLATLLGFVRAMIRIANFYFLFVPVLIILALAALVKRPDKITQKHSVLLLPLLPAAGVTLWGAYCMQHSSLVVGYSKSWTYSVFTDLSFVYLLHQFAVAGLIAFSKSWKNSRTFGLVILLLEFVLFWGLFAISSMACQNIWM